jgi:hypothetical protein
MRERSVFLAALEIADPPARAAYLDQACAGDAGLRERVQGLLQAHEQPGSFMNRPAPALVTTLEEQAPERPGMVIGPYKLMEQIGEGGMGLVFVAEQQQPVRRKVALKLIKLSHEVAARRSPRRPEEVRRRRAPPPGRLRGAEAAGSRHPASKPCPPDRSPGAAGAALHRLGQGGRGGPVAETARCPQAERIGG